TRTRRCGCGGSSGTPACPRPTPAPRSPRQPTTRAPPPAATAWSAHPGAAAPRRAVADVWLDNSGAPAALTAAVDALWDRRLAPFAAGLAADRPAPQPTALVDPPPEGPPHAPRRRGPGE